MPNPGSSEPGGKPSIVNPTDAVTKDNTVPFSAPTHVNRNTALIANRTGVGMDWGKCV